MSIASVRSVAAKRVCNTQYAALPYRIVHGALEILLITTLRTQRWIIPKGWPMEGLPAHAAAAREALEEAGVCGEISKEAIGSFSYYKQRKNGTMELCKVNVFALKVTRQRKTWAEKDARSARWCSVEDAAAAVIEPGLRQLIRKFGIAVPA